MGLPGAKGAVSIMNSTVTEIQTSRRSDRWFSDLRKQIQTMSRDFYHSKIE